MGDRSVPCGLCRDPATVPSPYTVNEATLIRLQSHIRRKHAQFVVAAFNRPNLDDKHFSWVLACAINVFFRTGGESIEFNMNRLLATVSAAVGTVSRNVQLPTLQTLLDALKSNEGPLQTDKTCQLCGEKPRHRWQHIAEKHLQKAVFDCPHCSNGGGSEQRKVHDHIRGVHFDFSGVPVSNFMKYIDEIRALQEQCYPDEARHMDNMEKRWKMYKCESCGNEVARDDRKRHVYREHLKNAKLFSCPLCNFSSNCDVRAVRGHMKRMHRSNRRIPISQEGNLKVQIVNCVWECFPGWLTSKRFRIA